MTSHQSSNKTFPINVFDNQFQFGKTIANAFSSNSQLLYFLAFALTQSGKTGSMLSTIHHFLNDDNLAIPQDNIFIITGISSKDWVLQTKERFPISLHHRIYHRNDLLRFYSDIYERKDVLIILDEVHIASKNDQTIASVFKCSHFDDSLYLLHNNIKFVFFTATPNNIHFFNSNPHASMAKMDPPKQYTSIFNLILQDRVFQYKDLCGFNNSDNQEVRMNVIELKEFILKRFHTPKYHIIRTHVAYKQNITYFHFTKVWGKDADIIIDNDKLNLDLLLSRPPTKHTFIFVKERLRCAKTICKKYVGVLYERLTNSPNMSSIVQGLAGRATGYDTGDELVVFSDLDSILTYYELWEYGISKKQSQLLFR
jgi:hypothetical protein